MVSSASHIFRAGFRPSGFSSLHFTLSIWPLCFLTGVIWRVVVCQVVGEAEGKLEGYDTYEQLLSDIQGHGPSL